MMKKIIFSISLVIASFFFINNISASEYNKNQSYKFNIITNNGTLNVSKSELSNAGIGKSYIFFVKSTTENCVDIVATDRLSSADENKIYFTYGSSYGDYLKYRYDFTTQTYTKITSGNGRVNNTTYYINKKIYGLIYQNSSASFIDDYIPVYDYNNVLLKLVNINSYPYEIKDTSFIKNISGVGSWNYDLFIKNNMSYLADGAGIYFNDINIKPYYLNFLNKSSALPTIATDEPVYLGNDNYFYTSDGTRLTDITSPNTDISYYTKIFSSYDIYDINGNLVHAKDYDYLPIYDNVKFSFDKFKEVDDGFGHIQLKGYHIIIQNFNDELIYEYGFIDSDGVNYNSNIDDVSNWTHPLSIKYDENNNYYYFDVNIEHNGTLFVRAVEFDEENNIPNVMSNNKIHIGDIIRYTRVDLKNKLGIYLMPKTIDGTFDTTFYFKDEIHNFKIFYYIIDNSSGGSLDVNSLKYATKNTFDYSSSEYGLTYGDKEFNISMNFLENVDYLLYFKRKSLFSDNDVENKDKHYYISFESDKFNYQVVEKDKEDDIKIINPNTGEDVNIDNMNVNLFTTLKNGVDMFKGKIANIFKLVSYMFECLPNIIQTFFIVMLFFIVLLLVFKLLI